MIIILTFIFCYSIAISLLAFYYRKENFINSKIAKSKDLEILQLSNKISSLLSIKEFAEKTNKELESKIASFEIYTKELGEKISLLSNHQAEIEAEKRALREKIEDRKTFTEEAQKNLKIQFDNLASKHLKDNSKEFLESSSSKLTDILKPYAEGMEALRIRVETTYEKESKERFALEKQVENLLKETNKISLEANNLTNALKGKS